NVIEYVFENNKKNIDSIKFELNKLAKSNKLNDFSEKDLNKFAENLISFTKDHFNDKEVLEEAWYHWFPMAYWYAAYGVATASDATLNFLGEVFNQLPTIFDVGEMTWNFLTGNYPAAITNGLVLLTKILNSMYINEKNVIGKSISEAGIDAIEHYITNSDPRSAIIKLFKKILINGAFHAINHKVQEGIRRLSEDISFFKVIIWSKYIYYYNLYWGTNRVS
ncbi:hypothetical protein, partial [Mesomycoplasma ovipneumoniae]